MREVIEYLATEWARIREAPVVFIVAVLMISGVAWAALKWRYQGIIDQQRARLDMKDQQLDDYRERLNLSPDKGSSYSKLTRKELSGEAVRLSEQILNSIEPKARQDADADTSMWVQMSNETDKDRRDLIWQDAMRQSQAASSQLMAMYDSKFKAKAIVIRDELLARLEQPPPKRPPYADSMYEHPTNLLGIRSVVDDLNLLAASIS